MVKVITLMKVELHSGYSGGPNFHFVYTFTLCGFNNISTQYSDKSGWSSYIWESDQVLFPGIRTEFHIESETRLRKFAAHIFDEVDKFVDVFSSW